MSEALSSFHSLKRRPKSDRAILVWLFTVVILIFLMIILGGVTRLTESGLSIVDWEPITGVLPPLTEQKWLFEFEKYQLFPEFNSINFAMSLSEFKQIYWFEWAHRLLGRLIGIVFALPFLWFIVTGRINLKLGIQLGFVLLLGGLQGFLGWYMVKSGLVDQPDVSAYRLASHLGLAVVIFGCILWIALGLLQKRSYGPSRDGLFGLIRVVMPLYTVIIFFTLLSGAFVAGNSAGFIFNTFPLMNGKVIPLDIFVMEPLWRNFFENSALVQLIHRLAACLSVLIGLSIAIIGQSSQLPSSTRQTLLIMGAVVFTQFLLGVSTLLLSVPIALGAFHQACAILVLSKSYKISF